MNAAPEEVPFVSEMRRRSASEGNVFWIDEDDLAVFDPELSQRVNTENFADLTLPDKLADVVRGRTSEPFSWKLVRSAMTSKLRLLSEAAAVGELYGRMENLLDERLNQSLELGWVMQQVTTRALLPTVIEGLSPAETRRILRDQDFKLARLMRTRTDGRSFWKEVYSTWIQISAGNAVRRELRRRAAGRRPRRLDLTDAVVDLLPALGLDRAVDAVTAVLTAIAGPPGAAAASLLFELQRQPDWAERLRTELASVESSDLFQAPTQAAPQTHRFVKEVLRLWSPPLFLNRLARVPIDLGVAQLKAGQRYLQSSYLLHHDPRHWQDPERFNPDRWLPGAADGPCSHAQYAPFGWAPKSCIGAGLGTMQLILWCRLLLLSHQVILETPEQARMKLAAVPVPLDFRGTLHRR